MPHTASLLLPDEDAIAIVGVGLIGGSISAALKDRGYTGRIVGVGRNARRLRAAADAGLIDIATTSVSEIDASLIVVATPVDRIVADVRAAAQAAAPDTLITDAGSVKERICNELDSNLPEGVTFIGSHPLAGSEKTGFEHADAGLFAGRTCVITPGGSVSDAERDRLVRFWESIGLQVVEATPGEHDQALALTSHLPHIVASALAGLLQASEQSFAASGFKDTTRIAAADPWLWSAIIEANAVNVTESIETLLHRLSRFQAAIRDRNHSLLVELLDEGRQRRDALE